MEEIIYVKARGMQLVRLRKSAFFALRSGESEFRGEILISGEIVGAQVLTHYCDAATRIGPSYGDFLQSLKPHG
jgi:hypothetical protein